MYGFLADLTVAVHVAYVAFVVGGEVLILVGWWRGWGSVRNFWFRSAHLLAILAVVVVEFLGVRCPFTDWEEAFRLRAGQPVTGETFMSRLMYSILYIEAPAWVFTAGHLAAGAVILATYVFCPPRLPGWVKWRVTMDHENDGTAGSGHQPPGKPGIAEPRTTPAEEWGERLDTGKTIARGGKQEGHVPGAEPPPDGTGSPTHMEGKERRAVADALTRLGERADPAAVADEVRTRTGIDLSPDEVDTLRSELIRRANTPPGPDQPPPQNVRKAPDRP